MATNTPASSSNSNSNNSNGFRVFASKFRDQAKNVAAGNFKLPTFDDMAQKDEYIHSPEFNVRGSGRSTSWRQHQQQEDHSVVTTTNGGSSAIDEASYYSTESSWSLLDRPSRTNSLVQSAGKTTAATKTTTSPQKTTPTAAMSEQKQNQHDVEQGKEIVRQSSIVSNIQYKRKTSTGSLLSAVSDALQPTALLTPTVATTLSGDYSRYQHRVVSDDDSSDQSSEDNFDEEDPIYSMMRNNYNNNSGSGSKRSNNYKNATKNNNRKNLGSDNEAPASVITIKKSSNRFMEDLRLEAVQDQDVDAITKFASSATSDSTTTTEPQGEPKGGGPFGGYFQNAAMVQNFNRFVLRKGPNTDLAAARMPPPLARQGTTGKKSNEESFEITTSTSAGMLGDKDLELLNQLKQKSAAGEAASSSKSSSGSIISYLREHRHFVFVVFTVLLCIFVYFRRARTTKSF
jgi:hypothetical protein